jgi:Flp pilus assembly protein TadD
VDSRNRRNVAAWGGPLLVCAASAAAFGRVVDYPFLNWDDHDVFLRHDALRGPGLLAWAFTTRYMEHYQPLAWLTWGAVARTSSLTPATAHAMNVALHAACAALVLVVVRTSLKAGAAASDDAARDRSGQLVTGVAGLAALFWALHPLRVEVVAWASAMPYSLALLLALLSTLAWLHGRSWTAVALFVCSLLARPIAMALPLIWLAIGPADAGPHDSKKASPHDTRRTWRPASAGLAAAVGFTLAESSARLTATLAELGIGARLTLAATAPWRYLWRTIVPVGLTPLDPLALSPRTDVPAILLGSLAIAAASLAAWRWRHQYPVASVSWLAYLALLAPAMGFLPSGLQATADRYTYVPAVPVSVAIASLAFGLTTRVRGRASRPHAKTLWAGAAAAAVVAAYAALAWHQADYWRDSVTLWTRAVALDARNDAALYNLGTALDASGRRDEALARYEQVLALVPGHVHAARNRDVLRARGLEEEGNGLADTGNFAEAIRRYSDAVRLDPRRTHSHASLGMALVQTGRLAEARQPLATAIQQGVNNPAVPNALAYALVRTGDREGALAVLRAAQRRFPGDPNVNRNLALLEK